MKKIHEITMLVEDHAGVLARVSGLFARRGFNIGTVSVKKADRQGFAVIEFTTIANREGLMQVIKQVNKLIDVIDIKEV